MMARLDHVGDEKEILGTVERAMMRLLLQYLQALTVEINTLRDLHSLPPVELPTPQQVIGRIKQHLRGN